MDRFLAYINGSVEELRHIRWPTRQQAIRLSAIVVGFTLACSAAFGLLDAVLAQVMRFIVGLAA